MITVVGSLNMDLVTTTTRDPEMGETIMGVAFDTVPGGKGANQAVAAHRLGGDVQFIGRLGDDVFGREYREILKREGISLQNVKPVTHQKTGIATITVADSNNKIIVVSGANNSLTTSEVNKHRDVIATSDWLVLQLEVPLEANEAALKIAKENGVRVILNPAPFQAFPKEWFDMMTWCTPNETEMVAMQEAYSDPATRKLMQKKCIVTRGAEGVSFLSGGGEDLVAAPAVKVVDTTGAGDTFTGALAVALDEGMTISEACSFAVKAASLSVTKFGAQGGMPTRCEVEGM